MKNKVISIFLLFFFWVAICNAQLTLKQAIESAQTNTPAAVLKSIAATESNLKIENAKKIWYPKFSVSGQATYQSDVTKLDIEIPGIPLNIDFLTKDQYKVAGEISQVLYDGGTTKNAKAFIGTSGKIEALNAELVLEEVRKNVIEVYFGILELDAKRGIIALKKEDIQANLKRVQAAVVNGYTLKSEAYSLEAAQLMLDQKLIELESARGLQIDILNQLTGQFLEKNMQLRVPASKQIIEVINTSKLQYQLFDLQRKAMVQKFEMDNSAALPKANLFFQGGYGKPGFNFLLNEFDVFYIGGVRAKWELDKFYTRSNDRQLQQLGQQKINLQKDGFNTQISIEISKQKAEIEKIKSLIAKDEKLLRLREKIKKIAEVQLENGTLTSADFLLKLNEEKTVKENQKIREIQLRKAEYLLEHLTGNYYQE